MSSWAGSGLAGLWGRTCPHPARSRVFTLYVEGNPVLFDISGLSIAAADFTAAVAANRLSEILLAGDDSFGILLSGSPFGDSLRLRGHDGNDLMDLSALAAFTGFELLGDAGDDTLIGNDGSFNTDTLNGGIGDDLLRGVAGDDLLFGDDGEDRLYGGSENDTLNGGLGRDILRGDAGDDLIIVNLVSEPEGEILDGGIGTDRLSVAGDPFATPPVIDLTASQIIGFERLELFSADARMTVAQYEQFVQFELYGVVTLRFADAGFINLAERDWFGSPSAGVVRVTGSAGDDVIVGRGSADVAAGSGPAGTSALGTADLIDGAAGNDQLFGAGGNDTLLGNIGNDRLRGEAGNDSLDGGNDNDVLTGGLGADTLTAGKGDDEYNGGAGNDIIFEGDGADAINGGADIDKVDYLFATAGLTTSLDGTLTATGAAAGDTYISIENLAGSNSADILRGNASANTIFGRSGGDRIIGAGGADTLLGNAGPDSFAYENVSESATTARDQITDFTVVAGNGTTFADRIDLSAIDAIAGGGNDAFAFIGSGPFSAAGQVRVTASGASDTLVEINTSGTSGAEMAIILKGILPTAIFDEDFVL